MDEPTCSLTVVPSVGQVMKTRSHAISQLERGADPRLSTVASYVNALGGKLEIVAVFDDERVVL
jgi:hypothetical protein